MVGAAAGPAAAPEDGVLHAQFVCSSCTDPSEG